MKYLASQPGAWRHPVDFPPPRGQMILILTTYGVVAKGKWDDSDAAWMPLPKVEAEMKERLRKEGRLK